VNLSDATTGLLALYLLIPVGAIGLWRWSIWLAKRALAVFYRPIFSDHQCAVTVVTAVYAEDPRLFTRALASWKAAGAQKIIAVIQGDASECVEVAEQFDNVEVVALPEPAKRRALAAGVDRCTTEIVVLADSDVVWEPDVLRKLMMPFSDPRIGGVGTRQNMLQTGDTPTCWERVADIFLDMRYADEVPATARWGRAISCLSGRTAAYRTTLLQRFREEFLNETFNGQICDSGDDKRYTSLLLKNGFQTWSQLDARVYSTFRPDLGGFVRQRIRWARNTYRSDLRALREGWVWRHPLLAIVMIDKAVAPLAQLIGLAVFLTATAIGGWEIVAVQVTWWHISRIVKMYPHLKRRPADITLVSLFVISSILTAFVKIYALLTLNRHHWLTREATPAASPTTPATTAAIS
jgi:hyaluronan synthase